VCTNIEDGTELNTTITQDCGIQLLGIITEIIALIATVLKDSPVCVLSRLFFDQTVMRPIQRPVYATTILHDNAPAGFVAAAAVARFAARDGLGLDDGCNGRGSAARHCEGSCREDGLRDH
jgi:hypothetical protein